MADWRCSCTHHQEIYYNAHSVSTLTPVSPLAQLLVPPHRRVDDVEGVRHSGTLPLHHKLPTAAVVGARGREGPDVGAGGGADVLDGGALGT
jgi:hypothetical protein